MTIRIDTDQWQPLQEAGVIPRRPELKYGSVEALKSGLYPVDAFADVLIDPSDYKEAIAHCIEKQIFSMFHQVATWAPDGFRSDQDGLPLCWAWSAAATMMDTRAAEDKDTVILSPVSLGYTTNWRAEGNYLESAINGLRQTGITPIEYIDGNFNSTNLKYRTFKEGWDTERSKYRLSLLFDTNANSGDATMIRHCVSLLCYGRPLYIAYDWWGHALEAVGLRWDESVTNNLVWIIRNSHGEDDFIELTGSRGVPDEAYAFASTILA